MPKVIREYNKLPGVTRSKLVDLNDLDGKEWAQLSRSVNVYEGPIAKKRRIHGAAFPPSLAEHFIKIYSRVGDWILDPFMGVGTVADVAQILKRNFYGFEVSKKFYKLAQKGIDPLDAKYYGYLAKNHKSETKRIYFNTSSLHLESSIPTESVALTLTSPPYANLLNKIAVAFAAYTYSKNIYKGKGRKLPSSYTRKAEDLGNLSLEEYADSILSLMKSLYMVTKPGGYNVWVVRDYREMTNHLPYVNLHGKLIELATRSGWILADIVIWDQTRQRHLVKLGGKICRRFYFNIGHSFILSFRKNIPGEKFRNAY